MIFIKITKVISLRFNLLSAQARRLCHRLPAKWYKNLQAEEIDGKTAKTQEFRVAG